jgi:GxxExxY protein
MDSQRDPLTAMVIGAAIEVHREMGPGLLESIYQVCMERELGRQGVEFLRQYPVPLVYKENCSMWSCEWICISQANLLWN